jgi:hypothetical protein
MENKTVWVIEVDSMHGIGQELHKIFSDEVKAKRYIENRCNKDSSLKDYFLLREVELDVE